MYYDPDLRLTIVHIIDDCTFIPFLEQTKVMRQYLLVGISGQILRLELQISKVPLYPPFSSQNANLAFLGRSGLQKFRFEKCHFSPLLPPEAICTPTISCSSLVRQIATRRQPVLSYNKHAFTLNKMKSKKKT